LKLVPVTFKQASAFIRAHHSHHLPPVGWRWGHGVALEGQLVGVATVGRPVARELDRPELRTVEVTRCCTDGTKNAASMLYGAAWRAAKALGYRRLITYTLVSESGICLYAAGWRVVGQTRGGSWDCPSRPRIDKHPTEPKTLWEAA
jgi:hypothetical protein